MMQKIGLSSLGHTWLLDLDGTIVKHNGYLLDGHDTFLNGAQAFLKSIPEEDMVIFVTSRSHDLREDTETFLTDHGIRFNQIIFGVPYGERILINDCKPSGLKTAVALSPERDSFGGFEFHIDNNL